MERIIRFRAWDGEKMISPDGITRNGIAYWKENSIPESSSIIMQFTGLKDKNGNDIYEGDIVRIRTPYRSTQTHTGDNIPNGSYTEPMEPEIRTEEEQVVFIDGVFGLGSEYHGTDIIPLCWITNEHDEQSIKDSISFRGKDFDLWDDPEEGDLQYLLETYNLKNIDELIKYVSGMEVIGNIHQNKELLNV